MLLRRNSNLESIFFTILTIFLIFNIKFKGLPPTFFISSIILFIMSIYYYYKNYKFPSLFLKPIILYLFFVLLSILSAFNSGEFDLFLISIMIVIFFLITLVPYSYLSYFKDRESEIIKYIVYSGIINAMFIIVMFLSSDFKLFYLSLLSSTGIISIVGESNAINSYFFLRLLGVTGSATYGMAVIQIIMSFMYVYYVKTKFNKFSYLNYFILSILVISAILSGRTAFVGLLFLLIFMFLILRKIDSLKFIFLFTFFGLFILFIANMYLPSNLYAYFENWILQLFQSGSKIDSLEANLNMYIYSFYDFSLLGDFKWFANTSKTIYYMHTDVGWYRFLFAFGYLGLIFFILFLFSFIKLNYKINNETLLMFFLLTFLLIVMFKGAIFIDIYFIFFVFFIILLNFRT